ncbi:MAG TPA: LLM class flavin-dependent oxidoreductase [Microthrixaceae bacterium]|nr:LLM class flavin-dependent oxidoreductase [Microthrixaceae bacterium]
MIGLRFDMRLAPGQDVRGAYRAALDMVEWSEGSFAPFVTVSEHHAVADGYLTSPGTMVAAMAARTTSTYFMVTAAILPLYDPVRLAEEMAVIDHISGGRVGWVLGVGYRPEEYALLGVDFERRGRLADEHLDTLFDALAGRDLTPHGRPGSIGRAPEGRITLFWGGASRPAARRAARRGLGLFAQTNVDGLAQVYEQECAAAGIEPRGCVMPNPGAPMTVFVADDVDRAWDELGEPMLRDATAYAAWNPQSAARNASMSTSRSVEELRSEGASHRVVTVDGALDILGNDPLMLHPLCGGLDPEVAWPYLRRVGEQVAPARDAARS